MAVRCPHHPAAPQPPIDEAHSIFVGTASVNAFVWLHVSVTQTSYSSRVCVMA